MFDVRAYPEQWQQKLSWTHPDWTDVTEVIYHGVDPSIVMCELVNGALQSPVMSTHELTGQFTGSAFVNKSEKLFPSYAPPIPQLKVKVTSMSAVEIVVFGVKAVEQLLAYTTVKTADVTSAAGDEHLNLNQTVYPD